MISRVPFCRIGVPALLVWLACGVATGWCASATSVQEYRLFASGNKDVVWFVVSHRNQAADDWINCFSRVGASAGDSRPVASIRPQIGEVAACCAVGERLHVFYRDAQLDRVDHYSYGRDGSRRERQLPSAVVPDALAGEVSNNVPALWAVVRTDVAEAIGQGIEQEATTQPAAERDTPTTWPAVSGVSTAPAMGVLPRQLVCYDGVKWTSGPVLPPACTVARRCWLSLNEQVIDLFWQEGGDVGVIRHGRYDGQKWLNRGSIMPPHPVASAVAAVINRQLVFAVLLEPADKPGERIAARWALLQGKRPDEDQWVALPEFVDAKNQSLVLPKASCLTDFGDGLVLARFTDSTPEMARWPVGESTPFGSFTRISIIDTTADQSTPQGARDFLTMIALAAVLLLVFWRRQDSIALPVTLPAGIWLTPPSKRLVAALVDMLPAAVIVGGLWYRPLTAYLAEVQALYPTADVQNQPLPPWPSSLIWAWAWFRLLYAGYCCVFEVLRGTTPGKRLLGCEVLSETLERPNVIQVILRNVLKIVELEPYLQIWPFLIVVFFTRNRQRVGDLLGRTIVIERHPIESASPPSDESDSNI